MPHVFPLRLMEYRPKGVRASDSSESTRSRRTDSRSPVRVLFFSSEFAAANGKTGSLQTLLVLPWWQADIERRYCRFESAVCVLSGEGGWEVRIGEGPD